MSGCSASGGEAAGGCRAPCCSARSKRDARFLAASFGDILAMVMAGKGVSQYRLCQLTGLGADTVCRLVNDIRRPTEAQVLRIALGLRLDLQQTNRLLEAADFYPLPQPPNHAPTGRRGWPVTAVEASLTARQLAFRKRIDNLGVEAGGAG